ncbi:MAG TPA: hypothetical protein VNY51_10935 [Candidatus Dormibacteraeota bacterium]|nr:hypothetical protein [Candidatus Dormibacteraeota bacterium]
MHTLLDLLPHPGWGPKNSRSLNKPQQKFFGALYEMKHNFTQDLIEIAGNLSTVADTSKIPIDRVVEHVALGTLEFPCVETATLSAFFQSFPVSKSRLSES